MILFLVAIGQQLFPSIDISPSEVEAFLVIDPNLSQIYRVVSSAPVRNIRLKVSQTSSQNYLKTVQNA